MDDQQSPDLDRFLLELDDPDPIVRQVAAIASHQRVFDVDGRRRRLAAVIRHGATPSPRLASPELPGRNQWLTGSVATVWVSEHLALDRFPLDPADADFAESA